MSEFEFQGTRDRTIYSRKWIGQDAVEVLFIIAHGYGEHVGRYAHVADKLAWGGGVVYGPDHYGHGHSDGEPALVDSIEDMVADLDTLIDYARDTHPGLPTVLIGHSMGGIIATRYAQQHADKLAALVLSGPVVGGNPDLLALANMDPIPEVPIDPAALSRDPAVGEAYASDPLVYHGAFKRETLLELGAAVERIAADPGFGSLPTFWIHGEHDPLAPYAITKDAMEHLRGSRFEERMYEGAMHEIFNETNQDEVIMDVIEFVSRVKAAA